jgi:hypothetical protein
MRFPPRLLGFEKPISKTLVFSIRPDPPATLGALALMFGPPSTRDKTSDDAKFILVFG